MLTDWMRKRYMRHDPLAEKRRFAEPRPHAIEKLIGNDHVGRRILLLQRSHGGGGKNSFNAQQLHPINVGAEWQFGRCEFMTTTVTWQKGNPLAFQRADDEFV